jgi:hypothetical protein
MRVDHSCPDVLMPKEFLHCPNVVTILQQVRSKAVPEGISTLLIIRRWCVFATTTIPSLVRLSKSSGGYGGGPRRV